MERIQGYEFAVSLDDGGMTRSLKTLRDEAKLLTSAMRSNFTEIKSAEGVMAAYAGKVQDSGRAIEAQQVVIQKLKEKQDGLDQSTEKGRQSYLKYENQIESSRRAINNLQAQQDRAQKSLDLQRSGLLKLKDAVELQERVTKNNVSVLESQGRTFEAQKAKLTGLIDVHERMKAQLTAEKARMTELSDKYGAASKDAQEQAIRVSDLTAKYKLNESAIKRVNSSVGGMSLAGAKARDNLSIANSKIKSGFESVKGAAVVASGGIALVGAAALSGAKKASTLQNSYKQTTNLLVTGGEKTAEATKNVSKMQADGEKYSIKYGKSQKDIADQYQELTKRGYTSKEALGAMRSELQASVASGDEFSDVVSVSSQVIDAFGMRTNNTAKMTKNTQKTVNELAYSADMTATSFSDLGVGMSYVGDSAHYAGFKLSEASAAMGMLSNHGLEADKAGTGLRKVINSLTTAIKGQDAANKSSNKTIDDLNGKIAQHQKKIAEYEAAVKNGTKTQASATSAIQTQKDAIAQLTSKVAAAKNDSGGGVLNNLGINKSDLVDANGNLKSLSSIMAVINSKTKDMGTADKNAVFNSLFGTTGQQAGIILAENSKELDKLADKVQKAGDKGSYVQRLADKNSQTAQMSEKRFQQAWSDLTIMFGSKLLPYMTDAANQLTKLFSKESFKKDVENAADKAGKVAGNIEKIGVYAAKHYKDIEHIGVALAAIWAVNKVAKFVNSLQSLGVIQTAEQKRIAAETKLIETQTAAYEANAKVKTEAAEAGSGSTGVTGTLEKGATTAETAAGGAEAVASTSRIASLGSTALKGVKGFAPLAIISSLADLIGMTKQTAGSHIGSATGSLTGGLGGAAAGAALGSVVPVVGTGIGAAVGGIAGSLGGEKLGKTLGQQIQRGLSGVKLTAPKVTVPKISMKSAYSQLNSEAKKYYSDKQKQDTADIRLLYKNGDLTKAEYQKRLKDIQNEGNQAKKFEKSSQSDRNAVTKYYAQARQKLETQWDKKISADKKKWNDQILKDTAKYGANSVQVSRDQAKKNEAVKQDENKKSKSLDDQKLKFATQVTAKEAKLHTTLNGKIQLAANQQTKILTKLTKDKGKLNNQQLQDALNSAQRQYKNTIKYADQEFKEKTSTATKTANAVRKAADRQADDAINAANKQYKDTVSAAKSQYKGNSQQAENQRAAVIKKAQQQRDSAVSAALDQKNKTITHASNQANSTIDKAQKQHDQVINDAKNQRDQVKDAASNQSKGVVDHATNQANSSMAANKKQGEGTHSIWKSIADFFNKLTKPFGVKAIDAGASSFAYTRATAGAYATGGNITKATRALVGEAGMELRYKPYSGTVDFVGQNGPEFVNVNPGEQILNAKDTQRVMNGQYHGVLPGYAKGTVGIAAFLKKVKNGATDVFDDVSDAASDALSKITNPLKTLKDLAAKTFNLDSVSDVGSVARDASKGMVDKSITGIADALSKLVKSASDAVGDGGGGKGSPKGSGVQRWKDQVIEALKANGLSTSESMVNRVLRQIATESSGNEKIRQPGADPDGDGSGPAMGLMQTKRGTFNAYAFPGHKDIFNGYDNLLAGLHYAKATYGPSLSFLGNGHGYRNGGIASFHQVAELAEDNIPEAIIPFDLAKRSTAYQTMQNTLDYFRMQDGTGSSNNAPAAMDNKKLDAVISGLATLNDSLSKLMGIGMAQVTAIQQSSFDKSQLYRQQARDQSYKTNQSL